MPESLYHPETWVVGEAMFHPDNEESKFTDEREAIERAAQMAKDDYHRPIAVWDSRHEIVHLFLCGQQFRSV